MRLVDLQAAVPLTLDASAGSAFPEKRLMTEHDGLRLTRLTGIAGIVGAVLWTLGDALIIGAKTSEGDYPQVLRG